MSQFVANGKRAFARSYASTVNFFQYTYGATFVSLENSMILLREASNQNITAIVDHHPPDQHEVYQVTYKKVTLIFSIPASKMINMES